MIPKVIYQTWHTKILPDGISDSIRRMMSLNPDYRHTLFDDTDMLEFVEANFRGDIARAYGMLRIGAAKADLWRYLVMFKYGGVYLDIDSAIVRHLGTLISDADDMIITRERNAGFFVQWCIISAPGCELIEQCIAMCVANILNYRGQSVVELTGPGVFARAVNEVFAADDAWSLPSFCERQRNGFQYRIYGTDYEDFCIFKLPCAWDLYKDRMWWVEEQTIRSAVGT